MTAFEFAGRCGKSRGHDFEGRLPYFLAIILAAMNVLGFAPRKTGEHLTAQKAEWDGRIRPTLRCRRRLPRANTELAERKAASEPTAS